MSQEMLEEIVAIARRHGAYILCDEVYRHLTQEEGYCPSIVDLYEKGISVSSMSKVFSLAGIRLGWIASRDPQVLERCLIHRDYDLISCGMLDETVAALALKHGDKLLARNRSIVRENLSILDDWVQREPHVSYVKPQAGTTALVYYDLDIPSYDFCKEMYHATGAFVTPGDCFQQEPLRPGGLRLRPADPGGRPGGHERLPGSEGQKLSPDRKKRCRRPPTWRSPAAFSVVSQDGRLFSLAGSPRQPPR